MTYDDYLDLCEQLQSYFLSLELDFEINSLSESYYKMLYSQNEMEMILVLSEGRTAYLEPSEGWDVMMEDLASFEFFGDKINKAKLRKLCKEL